MYKVHLQPSSQCLRTLFILIVTIFLGSLPVTAGESKFEVLGEIQASKVLPKGMLKGPNHKIVERVVTYNGFTNHFAIHTESWRFKAAGNGMVPVRIKEINAIAKLVEMKNSSAFVDGLKEASGTLAETSKNLIMHPVDTISGFPSGLYNIFSDIGVVAKSTLRGETTIAQATVKATDAIVGFSRNKRELAYNLGVNRFSDNEVLHEHLNSVAWAITGGTFVIDLGKMAVSGPAGNVITGVSSTRTMGRMMKDETVPGFRRINEEALNGMGFKESSIRQFIENKTLTPRHQTIITQSLVSLTKAKNREDFFNLVTTKTKSLEDANMYQAVAAMIAAYNETQVSITEVRAFENVAIFRNEKGSYVLAYPIDNFIWTEQTEAKTRKVRANLKGEKKELWISGGFSDVAAKNLKVLGWELHGQSLGKLKMENPY